ncbi:hypothetical protein C8Q74DRAFT_1212093 [Fomes fomentarius]|nr:hypothetical protein C8Q74DRAFT_1212093 [Fomes fomentarius]
MRRINSFLGSWQLAQPNSPVVFHAISGHNDRESTSPSYFDIEAWGVKAYVQALLREDRSHPIQAPDIGVITPYHAHVRKIRKLLHGAQRQMLWDEHRVIIISPVRSSAYLLAFDANFTLSFVSNTRRFNGTQHTLSYMPAVPHLLLQWRSLKYRRCSSSSES